MQNSDKSRFCIFVVCMHSPQGAKRPTPTQSTCLYYDHDNEVSKCVCTPNFADGLSLSVTVFIIRVTHWQADMASSANQVTIIANCFYFLILYTLRHDYSNYVAQAIIAIIVLKCQDDYFLFLHSQSRRKARADGSLAQTWRCIVFTVT